MARAIILLLDSFGIGGAKDAEKFGDSGADTFGHIYEYYQRKNEEFVLPNLYKLGLLKAAQKSTGKDYPEYNVKGTYGYARPISHGKDTLSGHWEITGVPVLFDWGYFPNVPNCFPDELMQELIAQCNLPGIVGQKHASGTEIIRELGEEHCQSKKPIIYTSADSVLQIAAHEKYFGLDRLYDLCQKAFKLVQKYNIARVIARPFVGDNSDNFIRTANRHDYAVPPLQDTLLDVAFKNGRQVFAIGKIYDIFAQRGITKHQKGANLQGLFDATLENLKNLPDSGILFTNFVDFDTNFGHRRDVEGYANALKYFDNRLPEILAMLKKDDLLVITADHGCDTTWQGSDHTRENIPILLYSANMPSHFIGGRETFSDIGQTIAKHLDLPKLNNGTSFI